MKNLFLSLVMAASLVFAQAPAPKPQPNVPQYGIDQLSLYPEYTRDSYEATFKYQAPAFDANKPAKTWFDNTVPCAANVTKTFNVLPTAGTFTAEETITVPVCDVSKVNLTGLQHFTAFVPNKVQNAKIPAPVGSGFPDTVVGPGIQATLADAQALAAQIGDSSLVITEAKVPVYQKIDPSSTVNVYLLGNMNVEQTLLQRYAVAGLGSPGKWVKDPSVVGYLWVPATNVSDGVNAVKLRVPVRALLPNETFGTFLAGILPVTVVNRIDLAPPAPTPAAGSFTDADRKALQDIHKILLGN